MRKLIGLSICVAMVVGCSTLERFKPDTPSKPQHRFFHLKWAKNFDPEYVSGNLPLSTGAPGVGRDIVYMGSLDGFMRAIDQENGRILWQQQEGRPLGSPPRVIGDYVYYGSMSGRFYVRHYLSGELKYAIDLGAPVETAPYEHQGRLFVGLRGHQLVALDAETGKILWNYRRAVPITVTLNRVGMPLFVKNRLILGFADGYLAALSVEEGALLWEQKLVEGQKFVDVDLNPIMLGNIVVSGSPSGELKGLDPESGSVRRTFGVSSMSHPIIRGSSLIVGTPEGEVVFVSEEGKILKRKKIAEKAVNGVGWWKDHLVVSTFEGSLMALDPLELTLVDKFQLGHDQSAVFGDLILDNGGMAVYSSRNRLYFFE